MTSGTTQFGSRKPLPAPPSEFLLVGARMITLKRGQVLLEMGGQGDGCYWLNEGVLKVSIASSQGAERILAILGSGSLVGECAVIDGQARSASVQALRDSSLTFIARKTFLECLKTSPSLSAYLLDTLVARLRSADEEVVAASFLSLKARVARALLKFAEQLGKPTAKPDEFEIRELRQDDVAALADVARENVSRILSEWRRQKLIVRQTPTVYVILKSRLQREAVEMSTGSATGHS
jgi:CRP/FNR family transcriptional regulator, cyclic AMP receptor protein